MPQRIVTPFRRIAQPRLPRTKAWALRHSVGIVLMTIASVILVGGLLLVPEAWTRRYEREHLRVWTQSVVEDTQPIERLLLLEPRLGAAFPRDEAEAMTVAEAHPALMAVVARRNPFRVFVRRGATFRPASGEEQQRYGTWAQKAVESSLAQWHPPLDQDPEAGESPSLVLIGQDWVFVKRWIPGSPEVEALLRQALGAFPEVRVGVQHGLNNLRSGPSWSPLHPNPAFLPPSIQTWPASSMRPWNAIFPSSVLGPDWYFVCQPWPDLGASWSREVALQRRMAWAVSVSVVLAMGIGWWLRQGAKRRKQLEAGRLASLMHSLKTPLAVHKLRCDSLRMGRLAPDRAAEELMNLGQDLDDLNCLIERGLAGMKEDHGASSWSRLGSDWFSAIAEDFEAAFQGAGRALDLQLEAEGALAHEPSLRTGLQTLLENALQHGLGTVRLRSWRQGRQVCISVSDEGHGLTADSLKALGEPFQRLGKSAREGAGPEGQGLGLHLLFQMARQEGWGLVLDSGPEKGFSVILQLPG